MSRTRRNYPTWIDWLNDFDKVLARGQYVGEINDPDSNIDVVWGRYRKRKAKRRMAKLHRLENKKALQREIKENEAA